ncbi:MULTISPECIES: YtxH domain-containing protein [unclassified Arthrobacter]|uniref:YtxH domain-containing protein n=1 Tax=unclassified Arthrobacter TaxID=235627 RepID=UPI00040D198C|nr:MULTISPECIES: YtxH domain-containing protein [unclassified Arthrobacter]PVE18768.1 YtxH domain-containing protein [Arthrobacter sp. Bz4]
MKNKLVFAAGMAAGYVLGSRAGRDSYDKLKTKADELWNNPKVQETVADTASTLKHKMPEVQEQAGGAVKKAKESVSGALHRSDKADDAKGTSTGSASTGSASTGPSGGNPAKVEDTPFQNQDDDTRPDTV